MIDLENLNTLFSDSPNAYLVMLPDAPRYTIAAANNAFLKYAHLTASEIIGKGIFEAFPDSPDNKDAESMSRGMKAVKASFDQALLLKKPNKGVFQRYDVQKNGHFETRFWAFDTFPLLDEHNQVQYIVQNPVEVSTGFSAEGEDENMQTTDMNFQNRLFQDYPDAVFSLDMNGNFLNCNKATLDLTECTKEEVLSLSFVSFIAESDLERVFNYFQKAIRGEIQSFETGAHSKSGTQYILGVTSLPIVINQEIIGIQVIAKNLTELKLAEKQIEEYHLRTADILESITDAFFAVDHSWTVTYWNKEAERMLEMPREQIMGKNIWDIFDKVSQNRFYSEYQRAISENISVRFEEYFGPSEIWLEVSAFPSEQGLSVYLKDITERKYSEEQLRLEREKYRDLFNLTPIPKWVYDIENLRILDVNESAIELYGYTKEEFLAMSLMDLWLEEDLPILEKLFRKRDSSGKFSSDLIRHKKKSGEMIFLTSKVNSVDFENRSAQLVSIIDVTEKLKAQQQLESSELRFRSLVQDGSDMIGILDGLGNYIYVSPTSKAILGIDAEFFIGKNAFDFIHEDDKERVAGFLAEATPGNSVNIPPFRFINSQNEYRWIETVLTNMIDHPAIGGIVANSRDVTDRINSEISIKESMDRYDIVSKATSDAVWDWDVAGNNILWNRGIRGVSGYTEDSYTADWWYEQVHPDDLGNFRKNVETMICEQQTKVSREFRFRCADGTYKYVLDRAFLLYNHEGKLIRMTGAIQDITERVSSIKEILDQNERLRQIAWEQSHLLRAPLSSILGLTTLLIEEKDESLKDELLPLIKKSAEDLDTVVQKIVRKADSN